MRGLGHYSQTRYTRAVRAAIGGAVAIIIIRLHRTEEKMVNWLLPAADEVVAVELSIAVGSLVLVLGQSI